MESINLFVYGTLRLEASANYLLKNSKLLQQNVKLIGYKMLDTGHYPIAVFSTHSVIVGDIFQVKIELLNELDLYEGDEYLRFYDEKYECYLYVAIDSNLKLPEVKDGNWLKHIKKAK